jgi:ABC-type branched-subunit amino acid transport system substrate-binding protein
MVPQFSKRASTAFGILVALMSSNCNTLIKLNEFEVVANNSDTGVPPQVDTRECSANSECTAFGAGGGYCQLPEGTCVPLLSEDCTTVTGNPSGKNTLVIGSLFSTKGAQAATNLQRQQAAILAVEQVGAIGGIPAGNGAQPRNLVLVSCDESTDLERATRHLVDNLRVPAIVGPNTSQDTLNASTKVTIQAGTLVITPTAVASSIASLDDKGLTWLMVPTDVQRAPLMIRQINALETQLKAERGSATIKLGILYRDDALGTGTRTSLNELTLNGKSFASNYDGKLVKITPYDPKITDQAAIIAEYVAYKPDIVVLAGTAEAITSLLVPLEAAWPAADPRPQYVSIDSVKVPELIAAASDDNLRHRIRGTGITPNVASLPVYDAFKLDYKVRFPDGNPAISGMGPTYDATLAIAFAVAASKAQSLSGATLAAGLKSLSGGSTEIPMGSQQVLAAFQKLTAGDKITSVGTFAPLEWDANGAVVGGTIEMWCISNTTGTPAYASSGLSYNIKSQTESGTFTACP